MYVRKLAKVRKQEILDAAVQMACEGGYLELSREKLASRIGCVPSLISYHWCLTELRDTVLRVGCERLLPRIVVEAVARGHDAASKLSIAQRSEAILSVTRCE